MSLTKLQYDWLNFDRKSWYLTHCVRYQLFCIFHHFIHFTALQNQIFSLNANTIHLICKSHYACVNVLRPLTSYCGGERRGNHRTVKLVLQMETSVCLTDYYILVVIYIGKFQCHHKFPIPICLELLFPWLCWLRSWQTLSTTLKSAEI